ncbi:MAG: amidohydrolase family protein [Planctomycetes bacterium]|nr:amidohydrolase family protein [Planctomycetota bacterium]
MSMKRNQNIHRNYLAIGLIGCGLLFVSHATLWGHPQIPGADPGVPLALLGATVHPIVGPSIEQATILIEKGRITAVGQDVRIPENARRIDLTGKQVYPGLFDAHTNLGLLEINSVKATLDETEIGDVNPQVRAQAAFNPDSEHIPVTRSSGVLLALTAPAGELLSGRSAVMQLDGWTWEDMTLRGDIALHLNWPNMTPNYDWLVERSSKEQLDQRDKRLQVLRETFAKAESYRVARRVNPQGHAVDLRWEAMIPVLEGKTPVMIDAVDILEIQAAVTFADTWKLKLIIVGGYDAGDCLELLRQRDIPVVITGVHRLPQRRSDDYDLAYRLPAVLQEAGVRFCISSAGRFGASNVRNLAANAGMAAAFGLPRDEALKSITLYPAQICGVADRVGSITVGKDATLIVTDGDPLETVTHVRAAFIQGRPVDLNDRHKTLSEKYLEKYRRLRNAP